MKSWTRLLKRWFRPEGIATSSPRRRQPPRLVLEHLEDRLAPAVLSTLASFDTTGVPGVSNSVGDQGRLIEDSNGNLFGTTGIGGASGNGTVFEIANGTNTISTLASFNYTDGANPSGLVEDGSGNLFGTTVNGGASGNGTVFEVANGTNTITTLASFNYTDGANPSGLVEDGSGNLFGTTVTGGSGYSGTVFEVANGTNTITTLASFNYSTDGANPCAGLIEDSSGNLFGTTQNDGPSASSRGTVFEVVDGSNTISTLASFNYTNGAFPSTGLVEDNSGNLFGTTEAGGASDNGTVFEVVYGSNTISTLASFNDPHAASRLVEDGNGNLFGTTPFGGASNDGTVFEVVYGSNTISTIASFNGTNGANALAGLVEDGSGNLFGTTPEGGASNDGTVFEAVSGSNTISTIASFNNTNFSGSTPTAGLIEDGSGNLFGTTTGGGAGNSGTVFEVVNGTNTITTLASFNSTNGSEPYAGLIEDSSGNLFGTTVSGGASYDGTVFEVANGTNTITTLASFNGTNGSEPYAGLIEDGSGDLFGTTQYGGASYDGTVFEVANGTNTITTLASFNGTNGASPRGLIEDGSGDLFGTTVGGGANYDGTVFEVANGTDTITTLASFNGTNGAYPRGDLVEDGIGNLFGTTEDGGARGAGTVFKVANGTNTITTLASFNYTDGRRPLASRLVEDGMGNLFGTTYQGGAFDYGSVFEVSMAPTANLTSPTAVLQPDGSTIVGFTLTASAHPSSPIQNGLYTYTIDWGDGTTDTYTNQPGTGLAVTHPYTGASIRTVKVTAQDQSGAVSAPVTATVVISTAAADQIAISGGSSAGQVVITEGNLTTTGTPEQVVVASSGGNDAYAVTFGSNLTAPLTIAGSGTDAITVNGSTDPNTSNYIVKTTGSPSTITWGPSSGLPAETVAYTGTQTTNVYGGAGPNYITDPGSQTNIYGGPGQNTIVITATTGNGVAIHGGGSDSYVIDLGNLAGPVTISNSHTGVIDMLTVNGAPGNNTISVAGSQITEGTQTITVSAPLTSLTVNGGSGNNQMTVSGILSEQLGGVAAGTQYGQLIVNGDVNLAGTLQVALINGFTPQMGNQFTIIVNRGSNPINGTFSGLPEGATVWDVTNTRRFTISYVGGRGNDVVLTAQQTATTTALTSSAAPSVFGQPVTFTATVSASPPGAGTPTGSVTFMDGGTMLGTGTLNSSDLATFSTSALTTGSHTITAVYDDDANFLTSASGNLSQTVNAAPTTTSGSVSGTGYFGQTLTLSATVLASSPSTATPNGSVDFFDTTSNTDLGTATLSASGTATLTTATLPTGKQTITLSYAGSSNFLASNSSVTASIVESIYLLNSSASAELSVSGNATVNIAGLVQVDSKSSKAVQVSGNAKVTAGSIQVVGGAQASGNASYSVKPVTGAASVFDPEAGLAAPTGGTSQGSVSLSGNASKTINPGVYSQINVSGNATLTMNPGTYVIAGGGFTVTGNASVSGSGVMIYNAGSNYPGTGGNFGGITLSGNGTISLTAPSTGTYAGIAIFQSRDNTRAIGLSGNGAAGLNGGLIYAPQALLNLSGNAQVKHSPLIVAELQLSGNGSSTLTNGADSTNNTAGTLLAGDLSIYVDNSNGYFTADELSQIQDAVTNTNTLLVPYGVAVSAVSDPSLANITIDSNTTSPLGGVAGGVLGCFTIDTGEITLIQGWDWYAGADPTAIGAGQYSFETTVTHELGHALGLGHSTDPNSAMFESLPTGAAKGGLTVADLNLPPLDTTNADALHAAGFGSESDNSVLAATPIPAAPTAGAAAGSRTGGDTFTIPSATTVAIAGTVARGTPAEIGSAMAIAPARGDLLGIAVTVSAGPQGTGALPSRGPGAAGYGLPEGGSLAQSLFASPERDKAPGESLLGTRVFPKDHAVVDSVMKQFAPAQPVLAVTGRPTTPATGTPAAGGKAGDSNVPGAEIWGLFTLLGGGLALSPPAAQRNTRRLLLENKERRSLGS